MKYTPLDIEKDAAVDAAMQAQADKRTEDLAAQGIAADVNYDPVTWVLNYWRDRTLAGFNTVGTAQTNPTW